MGTHPIFESDFDCLTEMYRANLSLVTGRLVRRSTRTYLKPGEGNQYSWMQSYKVSLSHSPEIYVLSTYAISMLLVMAWTSKNTWEKNEITFLPYVNQDYNAKHNRIDWVDPRAQRGATDLARAPSFFADEAWKSDLKLLLEEIHDK